MDGLLGPTPRAAELPCIGMVAGSQKASKPSGLLTAPRLDSEAAVLALDLIDDF